MNINKMCFRQVVPALFFSLLCASSFSVNADIEVRDETLYEAHQRFKTEIINDSFDNIDPPWEAPPEIFNVIKYPAKLGDMYAYLTPPPANKKMKLPAVIWLNGGYGGIGGDDYFWQPKPVDNDQTGATFRDPNMVLMIPSFRGENTNPGRYEMFYGELEDLESAREYLASLPYIDSKRIYVVGHSTGGTRALLASEYSDKFRAIFSLGGIPDLKLRAEGDMIVELPFDRNNEEEFNVRSVYRYIKSIKTPTFYFEGRDYFWNEFNELRAVAMVHDIPLKIYNIKNGDHFNIIVPVSKLIKDKILLDTDTTKESNIRFTNEEIKWINKQVR
ncbi:MULTISPECIES: alpha/beta hydrolase family protein [Proteus]|uniref:alpha/beta hydrolase family protein n=1 Tax=Proteus TaxID=583 RepID=UPI0018E48E91|nr:MULTISPECIES: prolyl oligopeptidase family serine peptidase [Proteus]MBI6404737.1 prolyl oligopeptidase family serine peptidase [Proteus sp. PR00208]